MIVKIIKEKKDNENRVAATPETVKKIKELGLDVFVEPGAGEKAFLSDSEYEIGDFELNELNDEKEKKKILKKKNKIKKLLENKKKQEEEIEKIKLEKIN